MGQKTMGNIILKISKSAPRSTSSAQNSSAFMRGRDSYNRSSLALGYYDAALPAVRRAPALIPVRREVPLGQRRQTPHMFMGLDEYVSRRRRPSTVLSLMAHVVVFAAILWLGVILHRPLIHTAEMTVAPIQFTLYAPPPPVMPVAKVQGGGGGGGMHRLIAPVRAEQLPKPPEIRLLPPEIPRVDPPKLPVEPSVDVRLPQQAAMPKLGMPQSPQIAMASQGSGSDNGFGFGVAGGIGAGRGAGAGPGSNGGYGGGVMNVGGGVSAPEVIHSVEPQFTPEARRADYQGVVGIQLIVDSQGYPQDVRVVRHLGMGLDEQAIQAVRGYRFRPATYQGHPVSVQMVIDVDFRLH
jgi:periplasmic protein TonB